MLMTGDLCEHEKDWQGTPHERLRLSQPVRGLQQLRQVVEVSGDSVKVLKNKTVVFFIHFSFNLPLFFYAVPALAF
jgi:hypothetical protein